MNENLNLVKILEGCPADTSLWSPLFGPVKFVEFNPKRISVITTYNIVEEFYPNGKYFDFEKAECVLFPSKENRDWSTWKCPKKACFDPNTLNPFDKILVRDFANEKWEPSFFGYMEHEGDFPCKHVGSISNYCIPYNKDTKHLIGTTDEAPEYYRWWE